MFSMSWGGSPHRKMASNASISSCLNHSSIHMGCNRGVSEEATLRKTPRKGLYCSVAPCPCGQDQKPTGVYRRIWDIILSVQKAASCATRIRVRGFCVIGEEIRPLQPARDTTAGDECFICRMHGLLVDTEQAMSLELNG